MRERLLHHVVVVVRNIAVRRELVDELRQDLRQSAGGIAMRHAELLRDLADGAAAQHFLQGAAGHRDVLPGALPGSGLVGVAALAKLVEDAFHAAVLLQHLQRHLQQRTLRLPALAQHAAERAVDQTIEHSHGSPRDSLRPCAA